MRAIEATDLGRAYGERVALSGVSLSLEEGETLAVEVGQVRH
jgi:heme exporter protein A